MKSREPDQLPDPKSGKDYGLTHPIGGAEYLTAPDDDIRFFVCAEDSHPPNQPLPVVFFEVIAKRLAVTDDLSRFLRNLSLPITLRRYFAGNQTKLEAYVNEILVRFPAIISRAGFLLDKAALSEDFYADMEKADLKTFYSKAIHRAPSRDVPVIGAALSKLEGWDAPDKLMVNQVSEIRHVLDSLAAPETDHAYRPLPSDWKPLSLQSPV